ncbi:MAG: BREX-2 system phosphatase PglZ [Deltaproteobacteria bacterium]|nr:BREX-2 system phosphatase PglZ [Deltaproteobacteria bacterium]
MTHAPLLLRRLVELAGGAERETGYVLVLDGEGLEDLPSELTTQKARYTVARPTTELGLRHLLWKADGAPMILVVAEELARRLPPDLVRRAHNERVHALSVNDVLEVILGVRVVGAESRNLQALALEHVNALGEAMARRTLPTVVDRKLLTELLVDVSVGEQVRTRSPADLLAGWIKLEPRWSPDVRALVCEALPTMHGDEGRLLAWALERPDPRERLSLLVVHGALLAIDAEELPRQVWGELWDAAPRPPIALDHQVLRRTLSRLLDDTLTALGDAAAPLLAQADRIGREVLTPKALQTSRVLPLAFADRCHALAQQAARGAPISAAEIQWLTTHRAAPMHKAELSVLEAMARVSRYLDRPMTTEDDILAQVTSYQRDGAWADLAAAQLRRALAGSGGHHAEAAKVLMAWRARRDAENRRFGASLAAGYEAALHTSGLTPLHRLWRREVAPLWRQTPEAGVFLVVLDGCSYPVFLELLDELAQDSAFPIGIRPDAAGHVIGVPALAPLPTVTSHARGAIFLGELPKDPLVAETVFRDQDEAKTDKARFNQNEALAGRTRKLFLKGDLADGGVALLAALDDPTINVVGAVFNAVDDQIGSSNTGAMVRLAAREITAFRPSLQRALQAGRSVLVTADHGHSPYIDKQLRVGAGAAPRFLPLAAHEPAPEGFMEIDVGGLGGTPGRRAFAWRVGVYLGSPQVGFHGGCALEEMVVPLAWLCRDGLQADEPDWWFAQRVAVETPKAATPPPPKAPPPQAAPLQAPPPQAALFEPATRASRLALPEEVLARLSEDEKAALVLLCENGSARASELAARLKKNPGRLIGLMVQLRRTLHTHNLTLFTDEHLPTGETLYRYQPEASRK